LSAQGAPKKLRIATEGTFAPYTFLDPTGAPQGFEVDLANALCKRISAECEFVIQDFPGMIPALEVGKVDAIISAMLITETRLKVIDFVGPYALIPNGLAAADNSELSKLPEKGRRFNLDTQADSAQAVIDQMKPFMKGKVVGAQSSTVNAAFVQKYFGNEITLKEYKNTQDQDVDLANGRLDVAMNNQVALAKSLSTPLLKGYSLVGPVFVGGVLGRGYGVGLRKSDGELKAAFERGVREVIADGTIKTLSLKWLGLDATPPVPQSQ
jgi:octopine/nopaline transport system substrate-binding protein